MPRDGHVDEATADRWWYSLDATRKAQVYGWLEQPDHVGAPITGQEQLPLRSRDLPRPGGRDG